MQLELKIFGKEFHLKTDGHLFLKLGRREIAFCLNDWPKAMNRPFCTTGHTGDSSNYEYALGRHTLILSAMR